MKFYYWKSTTNGNWYWHLRAANNQIVATGAEGYTTETNCLNGISLVKSAYNAPVYKL